MTTDQLLNMLDRVERRHGYWVALCPGHDDRNPSLSIKEGDEGILLQCHAGCQTRDITQALGLSMRDLFYKPRDFREEEPEAVYDYVDEQGDLLFQVCRFEGKVFRQRQPDGTLGLGDTRRVLYHLPEVLAAETVYVSEGEKDADVIRGALGDLLVDLKPGDEGSYGLDAATCNPMGAGKWHESYTEALRGKNVIIVADRDEPGRAHADRVKGELEGVAASVKVVMAKTGKDAFDHFAAGYSLDQLIPMKTRSRHGGVITSAREMADAALLDLETVEEEDGGYGSPWKSMREIDLRGGRLYACGGYTSDGKTTLTLQYFRYLSEQGRRVALTSMEMLEPDLRRRLIAHKTGIELWRLERPWLLSDGEKKLVSDAAEEFRAWDSDIIFDPEADMAKIAEYQRDGEYDVMFVDHLHRIAKTRQGEEAAIAQEIGAAKNLALTYNVPVWVVCQLRRPFPGAELPPPDITSFKGSSAIEQEADMALAVFLHRGPDGKPDFTGSGQLDVLKNRHGARPTYRVWLRPETMTFEEVDYVAELSATAAEAIRGEGDVDDGS